MASDAMQLFPDRQNHPTIAGRYRIQQKIASGGFGTVYSGICVVSGEKVACKLELIGTGCPSYLSHEHEMYKMLSGGFGIPRARYFGRYANYNILVMDLLGHSVDQLFHYCNRRFSIKTALMLFENILARLEFVHSRGIVHRDIKPANFLMGIGAMSNVVYMVDFGLAKKYRRPLGVHIPYRDHCRVAGNGRYASVNAHLGIEQSRRDDMEALMYMLIHFIGGGLPWQDITANNRRQWYETVCEMKQSIRDEELCAGLPIECTLGLTYCRKLGFKQRPDYDYLRRIFRGVFIDECLVFDYMFDWEVQLQQQMKQKQQNKDRQNRSNVAVRI